MDATQTLKDTENSLRDFIAESLGKKLGDNWTENCGVSPERIENWKKRKGVEGKRQESGTVEERLLYYADFYDLPVILKKHWSDVFSPVFGEWKTMEVFLDQLQKLRDPDAHARELLPHQKSLILGVAGEIRNRLIRYRSEQETGESYFPRIESIRDNFGSMWIPSTDRFLKHWKRVDTKLTLRLGDAIDFVVTASDPMGDKLSYRLIRKHCLAVGEWQESNTISIVLSKEDISNRASMKILIKSPREYHAAYEHDDGVTFTYTVLPPKN